VSSGKLYSVALPIGNELDISGRALTTLESVDIIAAEDTRKFSTLRKRIGVKVRARIIAYHGHNEKDSSNGILALLEDGKNVALVSDAGTPRVSDPGYQLIRSVFEQGYQVIPVPGPSSLTAALSISPIPTDPLLFLGFISPKAGTRQNLLKKYFTFQGTIAFFESVHRVTKLLQAIELEWVSAEVFVAREISKVHEELFWGSIGDSVDWSKGKKGEFVIFVRRN
jgi:16S rRNA (cytidine1402-2'-O)-methyltransferase